MEIERGIDCSGLDLESIKDAIKSERHIHDLAMFLEPSRRFINDPLCLPNMEKAGQILAKFLKENAKILIHFDVDVDGVTSGAEIYRWLDAYGADAEYSINTGKLHGVVDTQMIMDHEPDLLIIVDSLDSTIKNYKILKDAGIEIIVLDHHKIMENIPYDDCITLVSSAHPDYPNDQLSGAGVVYKFCQYMDSLFDVDYSEELKDLCAVGLVADMMAVDEDHMETRAMILEGLNNPVNKAVKKIKGSYEFNSDTVSFSIAPKVNAAMRMNDNDTAAELFIEDDPRRLKRLISRLETMRDEQNELVSSFMECLEDQCLKQKDQSVLIVQGEDLANVSGLIANKLAGKYCKPTIVVHKDDDGVYKGSGRGAGYKEFNDRIWETKIAKAFGHEEAFGVFIDEENFDDFSTQICQKIPQRKTTASMKSDIHLDCDDINDDVVDLFKSINRITGQGFDKVTVDITLDEFEVGRMGKEKQHLKITAPNGMLFLIWNFLDEEQYETIKEAAMLGLPITFVGSLDRGFFGRTYNRRMICNGYQIH